MKKLVCAFTCLLFLYGHAFAQNRIQGTVRDEKGPLPGVTVLVKHTSRGVTTNASGNFSIQANRGDTLVISFSGYLPAEAVVDSRAGYEITLVTDVQSMENVVVIGYGAKKKQNLTGAVSTVGSE